MSCVSGVHFCGPSYFLRRDHSILKNQGEIFDGEKEKLLAKKIGDGKSLQRIHDLPVIM